MSCWRNRSCSWSCAEYLVITGVEVGVEGEVEVRGIRTVAAPITKGVLELLAEDAGAVAGAVGRGTVAVAVPITKGVLGSIEVLLLLLLLTPPSPASSVVLLLLLLTSPSPASSMLDISPNSGCPLSATK